VKLRLATRKLLNSPALKEAVDRAEANADPSSTP